MKLKILHSLRLLFLGVLLVGSAASLQAQTTITTTFADNNSQAGVTFNFENANTSAVIITDIGFVLGLTGNQPVEAWYKTTPINGVPGAITSANGWTQFGSNTVLNNTNTSTIQTVMSGLTLTVPPNTIYGIWVGAGNLHYSTLAAGTYTVPGGGCNIITGTNIGYGGPATGPTFTPRGFIGSVTFISATPCAGSPTPGNTLSSVTAACPSQNFTLSVQNANLGTGTTFQWESSPAGINLFSPIAGATNATYTTSQTSATDYQLVVTCTNSSLSATSTPVSVTMNPFFNCYCASGATNTIDEEIYSVTVNGSSTPAAYANANGCTTVAPGPGSVLSRYSNFTTIGPLTSVQQGQTVAFTVEENECDGPTFYAFGTAIWIDFNQDGIYDNTTEKVFVENATATGPRNVTGTFTVPLTAVTGPTGMRITVAEGISGAGLTSCLSYGYGETEDFVINITAAVPCSGIPTAGTASGPAGVCANTNFTLNLTGYTVGSGITFQWESSPAGVNLFTPITGATNVSYIATGGITSATDYRAVVTCTGQGSDVSNTVAVTINNFYNCYCGPNTGVTLHGFSWNYINNVTIPTTTLNSSNTTTPPNGYLQLNPATASNTASLVQGVQYTINITNVYSGYFPGVWIDWDQSGTFDAGEFISVTTTGTTSTATFTVPLTATPGMTGLRVREYWQAFTAGQACFDPGDGETEDYLITVVATTQCTGIPTAGTASGPANACANVTFTLSLTGYTIGQGITIQWESSPGGVNLFTPVAGATNATYTVAGGITTATDYRAVVTCTGQGSDVSNVIAITMNAPNQCYCTPTYSTGTGFGDYIASVVLGTINNVSGPSPSPYYNFYSTMSTNLNQGATYTLTIAPGTYSSNDVAAWIDYNQDGVFDATEKLGQIDNQPANTPINMMFTVPMTALAGPTRLRIREADQGGIMLPCDPPVLTYGETEDYMVDIIASTGCTGTPTAGTASGPSSACAGTAFTLTLTGNTVAGGITIQWESSPGGQNLFTPIAGATNTTYSVTSQTSATDYRAVVTCTNSTLSANSTVAAVSQNLPSQCYCTPTYTTGTGFGDYIASVLLGSINNASGPSPSPYYNYYSTMSTNLGQGSTYTLDVTPGTYTFNDVAAWIDYNQDGVFDLSEKLGEIDNQPANIPISLIFTVPANATLGTTRLRIREADQGTTGGMLPCDPPVLTYGETEDYNVVITVPVGCIPPSGLTVSNIGTNTADISWSTVTGAVSYQYAITNSSTPPASGTVVAGTSVTGATFTTGSSVYYLHVRTDCGGTGFSTWSSVAFAYNDPCANAINISNSQMITGTTVAATQSMPACDATTVANDVWYYFSTGSVGGNVTVTAVTTAADIVMEVFSGTCGNFVGLIPTSSSGNVGSCIDGPAIGTEFGVFSLSANTTYYVRIYGYLGSQGSFTIQATGTPLSIKLGDISATNAGQRNRVDWSSLSEEKGDYFELERSADGQNFSKLVTIDAKGGASTYSYWDERPFSGLNHYRLKMIDAAGGFNYSKVVTATVKGANNFVVEAYPNPVGEKLTVVVHGTPGNNATVSITDVTGKVVRVVTITDGKAEINMNGMAQGAYLVKYTDSKQSQTIKVTKD